MTDTHGPVPGDQDADHEHDPAMEQEVWHGDQPPVDDFGDPMAETATVSEEMAPEESSAAVGDTKERSLLIPAVAGVGALLVLGAVLYWQFGGRNVEPSMLAEQNAPSKVVLPQPVSPPPIAADTNVAPTTALPTAATEPSPASALPQAGAAMPIAPPVAPVPSEGTSPVAPPANAVAAVSQPVASVPEVAPATSALGPSPSPTPATIASAAPLDARLLALSSRIEDLQKALDQTTQQVNQINTKLAVNPPASGSGAPNPAIEDQLNKLEQQVMQIEQATQTAPRTVSEPAKHAIHKARRTTTHHRKVQTASRHHGTISAQSHWVLRAATPDEAWVATSATARELRPVRIGNTLPGIGRVSAIRQEGDNWVVQGEKGAIR